MKKGKLFSRIICTINDKTETQIALIIIIIIILFYANELYGPCIFRFKFFETQSDRQRASISIYTAHTPLIPIRPNENHIHNMCYLTVSTVH